MQPKVEPLLAVSSSTEKSSLIGLCLIFIGGFCGLISNVWVRFDILPLQIISVRSLVLFLLVVVFIQSDIIVPLGNQIFFGTKKVRVILIIRAVLYFLHVCSVYWAIIEDISFKLALFVFYTFTIFAAIQSHIGCCSRPEKLSKFGWLFSLSAFLEMFCDVYFNWIGSNRVAGSICCTFLLLMILRTGLDMYWSQIELVSACVW